MPQFSGRTGGLRTGSLPPSHNTSPRGIFAPSQGQSATRETPQALEAAQEQSASLTFSTNRVQTVAPTQGQTATLDTPEIKRTVSATQGQSASFSKALSRTLSASNAQA